MGRPGLKTRYPVDLHCHTTRSDGHDSPYELVDSAVALGMAAVAITDHDIDPPQTLALPGGRVQSSLEYAAERGLTLVLGYEFSTNTWVDDVHICGYGLDWAHPDLQDEVRRAAESKSQAYEALCERLTDLGMPVDWEADILRYVDAEGATCSRTPEEVQRKHIFEAMAARGYAESWSAAKLLVRDNPELNIPRRKIDSVACIDLIHRCGGLAILAHPYLIDEAVSMPGEPTIRREAYIDRLVAAGLDGIEVRYTYDKTAYKGSLTPEEIEAETRRRYRGSLRFLSGGSDYHAGHRAGETKIRALGERGLTVAEFQPLAQALGLQIVHL
jgi:hypothetical protein